LDALARRTAMEARMRHSKRHTNFVFGVMLGVAAILPATAHADIRVDEVQYEAGILVVRGTTAKPDQIVTLDKRYKERSKEDRRFIFRIPYRPHFCKIELRSGGEMRTANVKDCTSNVRELPRTKTNAVK
jgi:hypothetical protein